MTSAAFVARPTPTGPELPPHALHAAQVPRRPAPQVEWFLPAAVPPPFIEPVRKHEKREAAAEAHGVVKSGRYSRRLRPGIVEGAC